MKLFKRLIVATGNEGKLREIRVILGDFFDEIVSMKEAGVFVDVVEDGDTFAANAIKKAETICALAQAPVLSDDSGLCVDALGGAPGVYSARFSGEHATDAANNALLLEKLQGVEPDQRTARFVSVVALAQPGKTTITATGMVEGRVLESLDGTQGFGYDPLFFSEELGISFGQATQDEKNSISHRARALASLRIALQEHSHA